MGLATVVRSPCFVRTSSARPYARTCLCARYSHLPFPLPLARPETCKWAQPSVRTSLASSQHGHPPIREAYRPSVSDGKGEIDSSYHSHEYLHCINHTVLYVRPWFVSTWSRSLVSKFPIHGSRTIHDKLAAGRRHPY